MLLLRTPGPFVGTTICEIENATNNTCAITINGAEILYSDSMYDDTDYEFDCSNLIEGEAWNLLHLRIFLRLHGFCRG
jgi:hypothetical protein